MRILKFILAIFLLPVASAVGQSDGFQTPPWLEFVEEIRIPIDRLVGRVSDISIDSDGNVHFIANFMPQLYSRRLNQLIKLDPEGCQPGAVLRFPRSMFTPDGEIVAMFDTSFFWFDLFGNCVHYVTGKTLSHGFVSALPGRNILIARNYTSVHKLEKMDADGNITLSASIDKLPIANIGSRFKGGGLVFSNDRYYWANHMTNTVASFDAYFSPIWVKAIGMKGMPFFTEDISDEENTNYYETHGWRILLELATKARTHSLSALDRSTLLLHARYDGKAYFQLFDRDGNLLDLYKSDASLLHNPNSDLFFRVKEHEELIIYVYRMK